MRLGSGGVPARQRGAPKRPAVLGRVAAAHSDFLRFAVEPIILRAALFMPLLEINLLWTARPTRSFAVKRRLAGRSAYGVGCDDALT